jgi:hypothetical protein
VVLRSATVAAVLMSGAIFTQVAKPASLVLTNGERVYGVVAFQSDIPAPSNARGTLSMQLENGRQMTVPIDTIALIDLAGGKPTPAELDALDADVPHVLVLRNGNTRKGRLVGIVGGEFVRWESETGARVDVLLRNVSRIYLQLPRHSRNR